MFADTKRYAVALVVGAAASLASPAAVAQNGNGARATAPRSVQTEEIELRIGEQRVIQSDGVQSYSEAVKGVVDVRLTKDASQFIVVALKPGQTTLLFLMLDGTEKHYRISVTDPEGPQRGKRGAGNVEARDNIRLDFYFVQMNKNYGHQLGIGYPSSIAPRMSASFDLRVGQLDSATAVIADQALPRLDIAQSSGWAKVMRQAAVVTANGEKATFSGGGEVNIPIQNALSSGVVKVQFGSEIVVEPAYDAKSGRVELRLHADISELEGDRGTGIPGRTTATLDTIVNLELGQSLVLGGLTAKSERNSKTGLPVLSQIPILGALFGSHAHAQEQTENVVIIVPSVVDSISMQDRARLKAALEQYAAYDGDIEEVKLVPPAPVGRPARTQPGAKP
ncbi:MAG TPA: pilus assembly protein N-terminal domain-containing protein [Polyangiaceae bacterium]|nr:pilus assembly protein N-terminal domain-containing protein [Polyangiaceae bacterium]